MIGISVLPVKAIKLYSDTRKFYVVVCTIIDKDYTKSTVYPLFAVILFLILKTHVALRILTPYIHTSQKLMIRTFHVL